MQKLYVIDASGYLYRSYFAIRNMTNAKGESTNALFGFIRSIQKLIKDFHPDHIVAVFDGPRNAAKRVAIYPEYKAHRAQMPADLRYQIEWAHKFCELAGIPQLNVPEAEADDVMGSVGKWASHHDCEVFLCTSDKDMCQLVNDKVFILNTHKENLLLNAEEVEKIHGVPPNKIIDLLSIVGDASDNIPGLSGFGPKTAVELLKSMGSLDYILEHPEEVPGKKKQETIINDKEKALISRRLVIIDTDVDFPKEKDFFHVKPIHKEELKEFYASMNFNSLIKELEQATSETSSQKQTPEEVQYTLVDDESAFQELLNRLKKEKEICFDTETTDIHPLAAELVGIGFAVKPGTAWYVPVNGQLGLKKVLEGVKSLFENKAIGFFGHNVKYDYHVLQNYDITVANVCFDTILASYVLNSHARQHSLDALSLEYFGKVKIATSELIGKGKKQITMREVPIPDVSHYCCEDVDYTVRLKQLFEPLLQERKLEKLYRTIELPLMPILAGMERHGIFLDVPHLEHSSVDVSKEISQLQSDIFGMAGKEFNLNSPLQLKKILFEDLQIPYPKKRASDLSTNEEILQLLQGEFPIAGKILEYRKVEKLRSTYIETLPKEVNPKTGRIHCTFNQAGTATGRLACQDPNLQNIPVRTAAGRKIREAFRPEKKGWSYLAADYSQVELRLLAHLSEDPQLIESFKNNEDIHARTAAAIYNIPLTDVTKEQRYSAKAVNFGIIYGQQAYGLSQELGISPAEAAKFIETYFSRFTRVREFLESCKEKARKTGRAVTITGRERLIPEINNNNGMLRAQAERLAVNTPLQGTAADIIKMAMLKMDSLLHKEHKLGYMILQIHDELIFEVPDFELLDFEPLVRESMERVISLKVPLLIDITIGKNWKEC
jgi:DNA polymerase-1